MGAPAVGVVTSFHYSAAHDSPENKAYVDAFMKANSGMRPNFHSVGGYDGMHLIYEAVKNAGANANGEQAGRGDEGNEVGEPARTDDRSTRPLATRCRPSISAGWRW